MGLFETSGEPRQRASGTCVTYERTLVQPPPWPRALAKMRKRAFPEAFVRSDSPLARHGSWIVVARCGRRAIGYAQVVRSGEGSPGCYLEEVVVEPRYRGRGVGRGLVREAARWMLEQGFESIYAVALRDADRQRREAWFESLGLRDAGWSAYRARLDELVHNLGG